MVDLHVFLTGLGLQQYVQIFTDNDIDGVALLDLEERHLKELGVSLGHRMKLLKAIAALRKGGDNARRLKPPAHWHRRMHRQGSNRALRSQPAGPKARDGSDARE